MTEPATVEELAALHEAATNGDSEAAGLVAAYWHAHDVPDNDEVVDYYLASLERWRQWQRHQQRLAPGGNS